MASRVVCVGLLFVCIAGRAAPPDARGPARSPAAALEAFVPRSPFGPIPGSHGFGDRLALIPEDTLFYVDNRGATRIFVNVNGHAFKLVTDAAEVPQSVNAFPIPRVGDITINIAALLHAGSGNYIELAVQGPPDSDANFIVANVLLAGQAVAYAIELEELQELPQQFDLLQSYPNPFRERAIITYEIPANRTNGVHVVLALYDVLGRRLRTLVDERRFPGRFTVAWDGAGPDGRPVASGVYFCRITAGEMQQTIKIVRLD